MNRYLRERALFGPLIATPPSVLLNTVVVMPAKDEERLLESLESLRACHSPKRDVEVIVVVNTSELDLPETVEHNRHIAARAEHWCAQASRADRRFFVLQCHGLEARHAGVGLARKIGMDEACRRLESIGNAKGVIACFDADSQCEPNYLIELEALFDAQENWQACSIYFEHPVNGSEFDSAIYDAITRYELHLRYFIHAQRFSGFPFAMQSIGSSMAVRCDAYQQQNGMNKRKAGEDFYFLHKFTPLGLVAELNTTCVRPSPRRSHRVPFGTGKAVMELVDSGGLCQTYSPKSFHDLRRFILTVGSLSRPLNRDAYWKKLPASVARFLGGIPFWDRIEEIRRNVTSPAAFRLRFFRWFNAFMVMKYLHNARDHQHPNCEITNAARWLLAGAYEFDRKTLERSDPLELLLAYRALDRAPSPQRRLG